MILRKISAAILITNYLLELVYAVIFLPYEIKAFGKNGSERYDIFTPLYNNPSINVFKSLINVFWVIGLLAMVIFLCTFLFEKNSRHLIVSEDNNLTNNENNINTNDHPSAGLNIISFLIPLVGLIIYLTERERSPRKATSAGKAALWGVGVSFLLGLLSFVIAYSIMFSVVK